IAITKVKIITLDKACKCDSSIAIGVCRVAISQKVVTLARIRELHIGMEYGTEARGQHIETVPRTSFQLPYIVWLVNLTRVSVWAGSIFKSRYNHPTPTR